ncbi:Sec-independent protein translocase protein TatB [Zavarzinia compransoris]|uniref:Sec-independent protein translocase protein TatB n=1 Tax=Zavarzinia compransoris TaxID=1264899 RepID=A0A317EER3_9PROT|nr:Sec-independent protein translocase protein TatB [Zavarzinia compransoris]PWR23665.1 twin-arginine translocase subunit TatB [Zavarzinia compransoris]TDP47883.1 sec-independent protein translocase protein TatB [Zavarzinia compransoris]
MFDLAWSEILVIGVVALLVVGPKELPDLLRTVGRWVRKARMMASNFQSTFDQMMRDEELAKAKRDLENSISTDRVQEQIAKAATPPDPSEIDPAETDRAEAAEAEVPDTPPPAAEAKPAESPAATPAAGA